MNVGKNNSESPDGVKMEIANEIIVKMDYLVEQRFFDNRDAIIDFALLEFFEKRGMGMGFSTHST